MATKKTVVTTVAQIRNQLWQMRLNIRAGQQKNTNAHKPLKKQLAQQLTVESSSRMRGSISK